MATSGTWNWSLDTAEIIQEAYERIGASPESGYDLKTARRSLNLLLTKWANEGVHLFQLISNLKIALVFSVPMHFWVFPKTFG